MEINDTPKLNHLPREKFIEIKYKLDGFVFWRQNDENQGIIEFYQVCPNRDIKAFIKINCIYHGTKSN